MLRGAEYTNLVWDGVVGVMHLDDRGVTWIFEPNGEYFLDPSTGRALTILALAGRTNALHPYLWGRERQAGAERRTRTDARRFDKPSRLVVGRAWSNGLRPHTVPGSGMPRRGSVQMRWFLTFGWGSPRRLDGARERTLHAADG